MRKHARNEIKSHSLSGNVDKFFAQIEEEIKKIEALGVSRDEIDVELDIYDSYGSIYPFLYLEYTREETDEEREEREKAKRRQDTVDRVTYERLRKKFEGK